MPTDDDPAQALVGTTLSERYVIERVLGTGGMGSVVRALDTRLKRAVAIKIMLPELGANDAFARRFEREAELAARLDHPNIVALHDFGTTADGTKYLVMQLLEGEELSARLGKPLPPKHAVAVMVQILRALEHAHAQGVIHRDLKPPNVFITTDAHGHETVRILDFGLAKLAEPDLDSDPERCATNLTQVGMIMGTPTYMSPEQAVGATVDHRADLYTAGVLLYQMLAGVPPFVDPDPINVIRRHVAATPPQLARNIPARLRSFVAKLMAKQPDDRHSTAAAARAVLEHSAFWDAPTPARAPARAPAPARAKPTTPRRSKAVRPRSPAPAPASRPALQRRPRTSSLRVRTPLALSGLLCALFVGWLFAPGGSAPQRLGQLTSRLAEFADRTLSGKNVLP